MAELSPNERFEDFLVHAPLYKNVPVGQLRRSGTYVEPHLVGIAPVRRVVGAVVGPQEIRRECTACGTVLRWVSSEELVAGIGDMTVVWFTCRNNCQSMFGVWFLVSGDEAGGYTLTKYGQHPPPERNPPKALAGALGADYTDFWRSGMTLRNNGYGIGAIIYFRRIVEGMTNDLLERLAVAMEASGDPADQVKDVRDLKEAKVSFDTKMEQAARMLPVHLRPGGANPVQAIFDVLSASLHNHTDAECCDLVDTIAEAMTLFLAKLNTHIEETKALKDAVQRIERLRKP